MHLYERQYHRRRIVVAVGLLLAFVLPAGAAQSRHALLPDNEAFRAGYEFQYPLEESFSYIESVRSVDTSADSQSAAVNGLSRKARALWTREGLAYAAAAQSLKRMGAPATLQTWTTRTAAPFATPLVVTQAEVNSFHGDVDAAIVDATITQCVSVRKSEDTILPQVLAWLRVSDGQTAVWAFAAGQIAAAMQKCTEDNTGLVLPRGTIVHLTENPPAGVHPAAVAALRTLVLPAGNLADIAPGLTTSTPVRTIRVALPDLLREYDAADLPKTLGG